MSYLCFFISRYSPSLKVQAHYGKRHYLFLELKRRGHDVYFHKENKECDFVIKHDNEIVQVIQVTTQMDSEETEKREIEGLQEAMASYHLNTGLILTENTEDQRDNISIMPIWKWLLIQPVS